MSSTPLKKDNTFLYNSVNLFEQGDRALAHNQFGAHIYTAELDSMFGAKKGEPLPDNPNLFTAYYQDPETGKKASEYVIDKIWDNNAGNEIGFASQYTGLADNHPTVINYAGEIRRRKIQKDKENAKQRALNSIDIEKNKSELMEEFPDDEAKINKAIKNGRTPLQEFKSQLKNKLSANANKSPAQKQIERDTSLEIGLKTLTNSLLGMGKWAVENLDIPNVNYAQRQEIGRRVGGVRKEIAEDVELDREFLQALDPNYGKDFEVSDMLDPTFWRTTMAEQLPNLALLYATGGGFYKLAGGGIKGAVAGALGSRPIEAGMEAVGLHDELLAKGVDEETAGIEASKLYAKNVALVGADATQLALMFAKVPKPFRDKLSRYIVNIGRLGTGALSEGYEEVLQGFWSDQGKASATGDIEPEFYDYLKLATPEQKEQFAIGALFGGGMTAIGQTISPDQVNNIIEEEKERAINLQQAKELEDIAPVTVEQELFQERVNSLSKHGDKIDIGFVDSEVTQVFTEDEIRGLNYNNLEEFQPAKLKEGDDGYVNDGTDRYELTIPATNYQTGDSDAQRVLLSRSATTADFLEDTAEAVLRRLQTTNPQLADDIFGWIASVEDVANQLDVQLPYSGEELFSKSFVYNSLGYADKGALPDFTVMPDALQDAFVQELETNDGGNLLDSMAILGQQAEPTQAIEDFEPIQGQESQEGFALSPMSMQSILEDKTIPKKFKNQYEWGVYLKERARIVMEETGVDLSQNTDEVAEILSDLLAEEINYEASNKNNGIGWYSEKIDNAIAILSNFHPELNTDTKHRSAFNVALAITSNGTDPQTNLVAGLDMYENWKENNGKFTKTIKNLGKESGTMNDSFNLYNRKVAKHGQDVFNAFMNTEFTVKELKNAGLKISGETVDTKLLGSQIFGSKIGGAFLANLNGNYDYLTMDRWFVRTFNRLRGEPLINEKLQGGYEQQLERFTKAVKAKRSNYTKYGLTAKDLKNEQEVLDLANKYFKEFSDGKFKDKSEVNNTARNLVKRFTWRDAPRGGKERNFMRQVMSMAKDKSNVKGITMADAQAIIWFPEKRLFSKFGVTSKSGSKETNYETEAINLAKERGLDSKRIRESIRGAKSTRDITSSGQLDRLNDVERQAVAQEGFSLKAKEKSTAQYFNQKVSRKTKRKIKRSEKELSPKQARDWYRTWSSQMRRLFSPIMNPFVRFQKRELDIKRIYLEDAEPFLRVLQQTFKRAKRIRSDRLQSAFMDLNFGLNNSNEELVISILTNEEFFKKRNALNKYNQFRKAHEQLHKTAFKAGLRLNYIETHFPRWMIEHKAYLLETFDVLPKDQKSKLQGVLDRATEEKGSPLTDEEKANIANRYVRDIKGITNRSNNYELKSRKIEKLTYDQLKYYAKPHEAMGAYINSMAGLIAQSEFMGNGTDIYTIKKDTQSGQYGIYDKRIKEFVLGTSGLPIFDSKKDSPALINEMQARIELDNYNLGDISEMTMDEQVGMILLKLENEAGVIPVGKEERVKSLLKRYFEMRASDSKFINFVRTIGYATAMGSISSTITQLADQGGAFYRSIEGDYLNPINYARFMKQAFKAFAKRSDINLKKLGIDDTMLQEMGKGAPLNRLFKATFMRYMDKVGKESYVNSVIARYKSEAKRLLKNKKSAKDAKFIARIEDKFSGQERNQVIKDLADGKNTELVELLAYSELLDIQPVAKSEIPVGMMDIKNGRLLYMLKTFMIKRIDFFGKERQMVFKQAKVLERQGKIRQANRLRRTRGYLPLASLIIILTMAEAGTDTIKDVMFGRKTKLSDLVFSNILKLMLISRYHFYNFSHDPTNSLIKMIVPPTDWFSDPVRDAGYFLGRVKKTGDVDQAVKDIKKRGFRFVKNIPLVGKHLYWRKANWLTGESLGKGQKNIQSREKKKKTKITYGRD